MTSGAIQCGVPMNVLRLLIVFVNCAATPKSASLTWQVLKNGLVVVDYVCWQLVLQAHRL